MTMQMAVLMGVLHKYTVACMLDKIAQVTPHPS